MVCQAWIVRNKTSLSGLETISCWNACFTNHTNSLPFASWMCGWRPIQSRWQWWRHDVLSHWHCRHVCVLVVESESRLAMRAMFPTTPNTSDALEMQQRALLLQQEEQLARLRQSGKSNKCYNHCHPLAQSYDEKNIQPSCVSDIFHFSDPIDTTKCHAKQILLLICFFVCAAQ